MLGERVLQVWRWYLRRFRRYRKKTRGGGLEIAPPSGARVNRPLPTVQGGGGIRLRYAISDILLYRFQNLKCKHILMREYRTVA